MLANLLEIERLARKLLDENVGFHGECDAHCDHVVHCNEEVTGEVACPKCATVVPFKKLCEGKRECDTECDNEVELDLADSGDGILRELELALVAIDMARERAKEAVEPTTSVTLKTAEAAA